jgi:hypothetical protein
VKKKLKEEIANLKEKIEEDKELYSEHIAERRAEIDASDAEN